MELLPKPCDVFLFKGSPFQLGFHHKLDLAEVVVQHLKERKASLWSAAVEQR
jgi:hypothetical protein